MATSEFLQEALTHIHSLLEQNAGLREPMAMSLATADSKGKPSVRTVLLKTADEQGFTFFTNSSSRKGQELAENPFAALCIYFQSAHEQIQVEGQVRQMPAEESDNYWQSRPRASQIGAWASRQSEQLEDRQDLLDRVARYTEKFSGGDVPRPEFWNGYRLVPESIEFWHGHPDRLNERVCYELQQRGWVKFFRYP